MKAILRALNVEENMPDQDRAEWTKVMADFETSDLSQREFAKERMLSLRNLRQMWWSLPESKGGLFFLLAVPPKAVSST